MQDIAGCRAIVRDLIEQDRVVDKLRELWPNALVHDRRAKPSYGYRAVHVVVVMDRHAIEIQIRTGMQHSWASATEKLSDIVDPEIKYGGGPEKLQSILAHISRAFAHQEIMEAQYARTDALFASLPDKGRAEEGLLQSLEQDKDKQSAALAAEIRQQGFANLLRKMETQLKELREETNSVLQDLCGMFIIQSQ
jgi:hypothetical protein